MLKALKPVLIVILMSGILTACASSPRSSWNYDTSGDKLSSGNYPTYKPVTLPPFSRPPTTPAGQRPSSGTGTGQGCTPYCCGTACR